MSSSFSILPLDADIRIKTKGYRVILITHTGEGARVSPPAELAKVEEPFPFRSLCCIVPQGRVRGPREIYSDCCRMHSTLRLTP